MNTADKSKTYFWLDIFLTIFKWKKFLLFNIISVMVIVAGLSLLLSNKYRSEATILPPENSGRSFNLGGPLSNIIGSMELPMLASPSDIIAAIAKSRIVADSVVVKLNLLERWDLKEHTFGVMRLQGNLDIDVRDDGVIVVSYISKDRELTAEITNSIIYEIDKVNQNLSINRAHNTRKFVEEQLNKCIILLAKTEDSLVNFQQENHAISLDEQTKAQIEIMSELYSRKTLSEIELQISLTSLGQNHPKVVSLRREIGTIEKHIEKMEFGSSEQDSSILLGRGLIQLPSLVLEFARLTRNLKIQETIFELLTQQYEQAKIEEQKKTSTISVLDYAIVPLIKYSPKRSVLVFIAGFIAFLLSVLWIWLIEHLIKIKKVSPDEFSHWKTLLLSLKINKLSKNLSSLIENK